MSNLSTTSLDLDDLPHYRLETDEADKVKEVVRIPVLRKEHYCCKQATYKQIKEYIKEKYGFNIHSTYITEIKRKHGVDMQSYRTNYDSKHNQCPKNKADAIEDALRYFNMDLVGQVKKTGFCAIILS